MANPADNLRILILHDVGQIFEPVRLSHPGCEFQFDEGRQIYVTDTVRFHTHRTGFWKRHGFGSAISGKLAHDKKFNLDSVFGVAEIFALREGRAVTSSLLIFVEFAEVVIADEQLYILCKSPEPMVE